jgi:hypothetical protein
MEVTELCCPTVGPTVRVFKSLRSGELNDTAVFFHHRGCQIVNSRVSRTDNVHDLAAMRFNKRSIDVMLGNFLSRSLLQKFQTKPRLPSANFSQHQLAKLFTNASKTSLLSN